jgi:hypothetical protein
VEALTDSLTGQLNMTLPEGWATTKDLKLVNIVKRNERQSFTFQLIRAEKAKGGAVQVRVQWSQRQSRSHPARDRLPAHHAAGVLHARRGEADPAGCEVNATRVGYIKGAGDDVPQAIERLGVTVEYDRPFEAAKLENF